MSDGADVKIGCPPMPGIKAIALPADSSRPVKTPIWVRARLHAGETQVNLLDGASNVLNDGQLPKGHAFYWYGFSVLPCVEGDRALARHLWRFGRFRWRFGADLRDGRSHFDMLARLVMPHPSLVPGTNADELVRALSEQSDPDGALRKAWFMDPIRDVQVTGRPIALHGGELFQATIDLDEAPAWCDLDVDFVLFGILLRPTLQAGNDQSA